VDHQPGYLKLYFTNHWTATSIKLNHRDLPTGIFGHQTPAPIKMTLGKDVYPFRFDVLTGLSLDKAQAWNIWLRNMEQLGGAIEVRG
jgi:hypothetical protein